jgi:hypothetical protein
MTRSSPPALLFHAIVAEYMFRDFAIVERVADCLLGTALISLRATILRNGADPLCVCMDAPWQPELNEENVV